MDHATVADQLKTLMRRSSRLPVNWDAVALDSRIDSLGFDSLTIMDLIYEIQQAFHIEFDPDEMTAIQTVGDLVEFLARKTG